MFFIGFLKSKLYIILLMSINKYQRRGYSYMNKKILLDAGILFGKTILESNKIQKFLCGEYDDGTARSLPDALNGVTKPPKSKKKKKKKDKKKRYKI